MLRDMIQPGLTRGRALVAAALLALCLGSAACGDDLICGRDTVEVDGRCVPTSECLVTCQAGTVLDEVTLGCIPELPPRLCDPATTVEQPNPDGVLVCSAASGSACDLPVACPEPSSLSVSVACGRIVDLESQRSDVADDAGTACDSGAPASGGPCSVRLRVFDAAELAAAPAAAAPLAASVAVDSCGRFVAEFTPAGAGDIAIELDDADEFDDRARTVTSLTPIGAGARAEGLLAFSVASSTDARWTAESERETRFEQTGASLALLREASGEPAIGVTADGALYFDEPGERVGRLDPAQQATGPNGAALSPASPAVPTRGDVDCLAEAPPFAEGIVWVATATVACP